MITFLDDRTSSSWLKIELRSPFLKINFLWQNSELENKNQYLYIWMPMLSPIPRCQCREFQVALTICHKSYNFLAKILTAKKLVFEFIFLSFCMATLVLQTRFTTRKTILKKRLISFVLKKFDIKHVSLLIPLI